MLLWIFRAIFIIVVLGILFVSVTSETIARAEDSVNFWAIVWSGFGMAVFVLFLDILTPKKKLGALAGVFFALLVGLLISGVLAPVADMIAGSHKVDLTDEAVFAIKWMMSICICYLTISIVMRTKDCLLYTSPSPRDRS